MNNCIIARLELGYEYETKLVASLSQLVNVLIWLVQPMGLNAYQVGALIMITLTISCESFWFSRMHC